MMNINNLYLIDMDTYLEHINEKVRLYAMVRQLAAEVKRMPCSKAGSPLAGLAAVFDSKAEEMFEGWGIPHSYLVTFDEDELDDLLDADLMEPEEAGYILCDGDCDDDQPRCAQEDGNVPGRAETGGHEAPVSGKDEAQIEEMSNLIRKAMAELFGVDVCVKYVPGK